MTSSTNGDGGDPGAGKTRRITKLSEQQKKDIGEMASPSQMPKQRERDNTLHFAELLSSPANLPC